MTDSSFPNDSRTFRGFDTGLLKVALGQLQSGPSEEQNRESIATISRLGAESGAELIVFPEFSAFYSPTIELMTKHAEQREGGFVQFLQETSNSLQGIAIVAGFVERKGEELFSTVAIVRGYEVDYQQKLHLYNAFGAGEGGWLSPGFGGAHTPLTVLGLPVGVAVCYDLRFAEVALEHRSAGAEVLIVPAAWYPGEHKRTQWEALLRARAIEHQMWVVGVGQAAPQGIGRSTIFDPLGRKLIEMGRGPESAVVTLDLDLTTSARDSNDMELARANRNATSA